MSATKKWCMAGCFALLCLITASIFVRLFTVQILMKRMHMDNSITRTILFGNTELQVRTEDAQVDWAELYPFEEVKQRAVSGNKITQIGAKILGKKEIVGKKISNWTSSHLIGYEGITETYNRYKAILHWNIMARKEYNSIVEIEDGQLASYVDKRDMLEVIQNVSGLADFCKENGAHFLYVSAPDKVDRREKKYEALDFVNANADQFFAGLRKNGVDYLDLRDDVERAGFNTRNLFFRTDHHWLPETGLWASGIISAYLNDRVLVTSDVSLLQPEKWDKEIFKNFFLGSRGKKVTLARATPDDISIYHPKWDTHFHLEIPGKAMIREGSFDILYDRKYLAKVDYYHGNPYAAYSWGDMPYMYIRNEDATNDKTLLLIKNSMGNVVLPFLALQFKHTYEIDLRHFNGSARELIRQKKPDVVMILYSIAYLAASGEINYETHADPWDFK